MFKTDCSSQLDSLFQTLSGAFALLPGTTELFPAHRSAGQQPDFLCGPYWLSVLLNAYGVSSLDPAQLAQLAGSILPSEEPVVSRPPNILPRQEYSVPLPIGDLSESGTSVMGMIAATLAASEGRYTLIPLQAPWTGEQVEALLQLCQAHSYWKAVPICNLQTGLLWGDQLGLAEAIAYLQGSNIQPPSARWNVGHYLTLAGHMQGSDRSLVIVRDTYPSFGWNGYYLQPSKAIAAALNRKDHGSGGILLFAETHDQPEIEQECCTLGCEIALWDNGTPWTEPNI